MVQFPAFKASAGNFANALNNFVTFVIYFSLSLNKSLINV